MRAFQVEGSGQGGPSRRTSGEPWVVTWDSGFIIWSLLLICPYPLPFFCFPSDLRKATRCPAEILVLINRTPWLCLPLLLWIQLFLLIMWNLISKVYSREARQWRVGRQSSWEQTGVLLQWEQGCSEGSPKFHPVDRGTRLRGAFALRSKKPCLLTIAGEEQKPQDRPGLWQDHRNGKWMMTCL